MDTENGNILSFIGRQLSAWPEVRLRFDGLPHILYKTLTVNGTPVKVQFNPLRVRSATAKTDTQSVSSRLCFLCSGNRPARQISMPWKNCQILVNPYPVLPSHLTIADNGHTPQTIAGRMSDMLALSRLLTGFVVLYNGPRCGASAPDHFHFQAVEAGHTALEQTMYKWAARAVRSPWKTVEKTEGNNFSGYQILLSGSDMESLCSAFGEIYQRYASSGNEEPGMNIVCRYISGTWQLQVIPRIRHRPGCFFAESGAQLLVSPGVLDMAGILVTSRASDFDRITASVVDQIYHEVAVFVP